MKQATLIVFLSFITFQGFAQQHSVGIYGGGGIATNNNYDVGISGGLEYLKQIFDRTMLGAGVFYQGYGVLLDNEAYGAKNGVGNAGVTVLNKSAYVFFAPKISHFFGRNQQTVCGYIDGGIGYNMGGTETMRKWDRSYGAAVGNFDSTIDTSPNINKMLFRVGVGFTEYVHLSKKWWFTITEDFGYITKSLSTTTDATDPERTQYTPHSLRPDYVSLQIGISHTKQ